MSKILIACEESQAVTIEFRKLGFNAFSCDIQDCSGGFPEWHIKADVTEVLKEKWALIIAFPPCTHLAVSGARHFEQKRKDFENNRNKDYFEIKKEKIMENLPEYIYPMFKATKIVGYYVEFVPTYDGNTYPRKNFNYLSSNFKNIRAAKRYIKSLEICNKDKLFLQNNMKLPKNISFVKNPNHDIIGYCVNNYLVKKDGKVIKIIRKKFCSTKETMEKKYNDTINYLESIRSKYEICS